MEANTGETCTSSSSSSSTRPVVVRVKRKASQSPVEAFWLEINERPSKRAVLDFAKLSLSESHGNKEEVKKKKVFVQHVETVINSEATITVLQSIVPKSADSSEFKAKARVVKESNKQDQLLSRSKQKHENLAKNARFEQIWKSRKGKKDTMDGNLQEICHFYEVVRVDCEENYSKKEEASSSLEESLILRDYLPLLKECLPSVAEEFEADMQSYISSQGSVDGYVYDLYTVQDDSKANYEDSSYAYPLVLVEEEDDFYDGPMQSEYESDDSNAEDNPLNEYPDEESSSSEEESEEEEEEEGDDEDKDEDEETESSDNQSVEFQNKHYDDEDSDLFYEEEDSFDGDYSEDEEDNRVYKMV